MNSIFITPKSEQEYSQVMTMLKKMHVHTIELDDDEFTPMSLNELNEMIELSEKDIEEGRVISQEELEEEIKHWR